MYIPAQFEESNVEVLHAFMQDQPFATVVTHGSGGLNANHFPLLLDPDPSPYGTLRGHMSRANDAWREAAGTDALIIFQGPHSYISPSWYPARQETGRVVPTWNYVVVHAYGTLRVVDDPEWVRRHVEQLTDTFEGPQAERWRVSDAPADWVDSLVQGIVGFELPIARLLGKWKVSQNRGAADRAGAIAGLEAAGDPASAAMAKLIEGAR
jgi:transcriptional regulator